MKNLSKLKLKVLSNFFRLHTKKKKLNKIRPLKICNKPSGCVQKKKKSTKTIIEKNSSPL